MEERHYREAGPWSPLTKDASMALLLPISLGPHLCLDTFGRYEYFPSVFLGLLALQEIDVRSGSTGKCDLEIAFPYRVLIQFLEKSSRRGPPLFNVYLMFDA